MIAPNTADYFNPRLREGGDFAPTGVIRLESYFNPRLREGDDGGAVTEVFGNDNFNPRLREGDDGLMKINFII